MDILKIIQQHGETITSVAAKIGVTRPTLSNNLKKPSYTTLERIAAALQVEPWQLLAPPSVVADVERSRQATASNATGCPLVGVVRVGADTYTANNLAELRALVERIEHQQTATAAPGTIPDHPHP